MTPQFAGILAYEAHSSARLNGAIVGNPSLVADPGLPPAQFDAVCRACDDLAGQLRAAGVRVVRNESCPFPRAAVGLADGDGAGSLTAYGGPSFRMVGHVMVTTWSRNPDKSAAYSGRQGHLRLFEDDPALVSYAVPSPAAGGPPPGAGSYAMTPGDFCLLADGTVLFGYGVAHARLIHESYDGRHCSAGNPVGREMLMRMLARFGYRWAEFHFDSHLADRANDLLLLIEPGVVALPDVPGHGIWGDLPACLAGCEIIPIPLADVERGACAGMALGGGRIAIDQACGPTMRLLERRGYTPVPIDFQACWQVWRRGIDSAVIQVWREN